MDFTDLVGDLLINKYKCMNNTVNMTDVTFMSLAMADFTAAAAQLVSHDYYVAGGLALLGIALVYLYHKMGS